MHFSRARLCGHREGLELSRAALGERVGLTSSQVEDIENGYAVPAESRVRALAVALSLPLRELDAISTTWHEDYANAFLSHAPLERQDVLRAAQTLHGLRERRLRRDAA